MSSRHLVASDRRARSLALEATQANQCCFEHRPRLLPRLGRESTPAPRAHRSGDPAAAAAARAPITAGDQAFLQLLTQRKVIRGVRAGRWTGSAANWAADGAFDAGGSGARAATASDAREFEPEAGER